MSFRLLFRSLPFLALVLATISLVCFGVQEKKVGKNSCFGVPLLRGLVMPVFCGPLSVCFEEADFLFGRVY